MLPLMGKRIKSGTFCDWGDFNSSLNHPHRPQSQFTNKIEKNEKEKST